MVAQAPRRAAPKQTRPLRVPQGREREPLRAQRKRAQKRGRIVLAILIVLIVALIFTVLWLPAFRIQSVTAEGPDMDGVSLTAQTQLQGAYFYILPRNSILFFSASRIRAAILAAYPNISTVVVSPTSTHSIKITSIPRQLSFLWCGEARTSATSLFTTSVNIASSTISASDSAVSSTTPSVATLDSQSSCYQTDAEGVLFAPVTDPLSIPAGTLRVYGSILPRANSSSLLGSTLTRAAIIPTSLEFIKVIRGLGVSITSLVFRADEADMYAQSGTRITYVLGREQMAAQLAESAFSSLSLNDGSLDYVDLRFDGKVYFKKVGGVPVDASTVSSAAPAAVPNSALKSTASNASSTASSTKSHSTKKIH
jgi:hypothetical protein